MPDFVTLAAALQVCLIPAAVIAWAIPPTIPIIDRSVDRDASGFAAAAKAVARVERGQGAGGEASVAAVTDVGTVDRVAFPRHEARGVERIGRARARNARPENRGGFPDAVGGRAPGGGRHQRCVGWVDRAGVPCRALSVLRQVRSGLPSPFPPVGHFVPSGRDARFARS